MSTATKPRVEFFFDVVCPYAYLAHTQVKHVCEEAAATVEWIPILLGGLFREVGAGEGPMAGMPDAKARLNLLDMQRWAEHFDVPLNMPANHPRRTVLAMRAIIASGDIERAGRALFRRYWRDGLDLADERVVRDALDAEGFSGADLVAAAGDPVIKAALRENTSRAARAGAFGVPTFVVHREGCEPALIWGQDRMHFIPLAARGQLLTEVPA